MEKRDKIGFTIGFLIFIAIGVWAVLDPAAMDGYTAMGTRSSLKQLVADLWGRGRGVGMMVLGALALVGVHTSE